ncbi:P-loop NTPase [Salmonella phage SE_PL]|nr:hypothetical protein 7t3_0114 [Salmonella phage 7t3]QIG63054.1 P-loop NTPase [Salmonella phage SE_PL]
MTREEKAIQIEKNFNSMMDALECLLSPESTVNSMIVSGKGGVGKTYNIEQRLMQADSNLECTYKSISGKITTMGLFKALYESRHSTDVLLLDDVDVFANETTIDLLKAVLDTTDVRTVSYITSSKALAESGIPQQFDFRGKVIFITNKNLARMAKAENSLSPHVDALLTRSIFIDLQLFTNEEVMIHVENLMRKHNMLVKHGINKQGSDMILNWMLKHESKLRSPSLRMPVLIAGMYNKFPFDWEEKCENMFLEK